MTGSGGRAGRWRPGILAAAVASLALLATACGGGSTPAPTALTSYQKELAFSQCMRTHGVPNMPDPTVNAEGVSINVPGGPNSPFVRSAMRACQKLQPGAPG